MSVFDQYNQLKQQQALGPENDYSLALSMVKPNEGVAAAWPTYDAGAKQSSPAGQKKAPSAAYDYEPAGQSISAAGKSAGGGIGGSLGGIVAPSTPQQSAPQPQAAPQEAPPPAPPSNTPGAATSMVAPKSAPIQWPTYDAGGDSGGGMDSLGSIASAFI